MRLLGQKTISDQRWQKSDTKEAVGGMINELGGRKGAFNML